MKFCNGFQVSSREDLLHPIQAIVVRKKKEAPKQQGQGIIDSSNRSTNEDEEEQEINEPMPQFEGKSSNSQDYLT